LGREALRSVYRRRKQTSRRAAELPAPCPSGPADRRGPRSANGSRGDPPRRDPPMRAPAARRPATRPGGRVF
jgi:hypothetical protein